MKHIADRFVVLLDANVLFPFRKRDILLRFYHAGLYRARWSGQILDEWTRNLLSLRPDLSASISSQLDAMRREFPEALVTGYERLIEGLESGSADMSMDERFKKLEDRVNKMQDEIVKAEKANDENAKTLKSLKNKK